MAMRQRRTTMNFEHNDISRKRVAHGLHRARQALLYASDPQLAEFERLDLRITLRRITDTTGSVYVAERVGKYRNFRYWTAAALELVRSGAHVPRRLTGEHAIEIDMLADKFVEAVGCKEVSDVQTASAWLAAKITIVVMKNEEKKAYEVDKPHTITWDALMADPFARYRPELRQMIVDRGNAL